MACSTAWWDVSDTQVEEGTTSGECQRTIATIMARRRVVSFLLPALLKDGRGPQGKKSRGDKPPFSWELHVRRFNEEEFRRRYRMDFDSFNVLLERLRPHLEHSGKAKLQELRGNSGVVVSAEVKLAIALRYFAGGDVLDLMLIYGVSKPHVYTCVYGAIDAINATLELKFPLHDIERLKELEAGFRAKSRRQVWAGQVGAIDGVHFRMRGPGPGDVPDPLKYYVARKAEYALLCMAICDVERRFLHYDISKGPNTHDSLAWEASKLGVSVLAGELPSPFFLNGDAAFPLSNSVMCPSGDPTLDAFDFEQSSNRMPIECAFGMLVRKWGVFWRPLAMRFDRRAPLVGACMRLHNFCIDQRVIADNLVTFGCFTEVQPQRLAKTPHFDRDGLPVDFLDIERGPTRDYRRQKSCQRRDELVQAIKNAGLTRPALAPKDGIAKRKKVKKRRGRPSKASARMT